MAQPRIPFSRCAILTVLASAPMVAVFFALAGTGRLAWIWAILSAALCVSVLAGMVRYGLGDVYRVLQFSEALALDGETEAQLEDMSGLFPEFSEAVGKLRQAWERDRGRLNARASSVETLLESLPHPLILLNENRQIVRITEGARQLLGTPPPNGDLSTVLRDPTVLDIVDRAAADKANEMLEVDFTLPSGVSLNAQTQTLSHAAADGISIVVALFDVTEIRQAQQMRSDFVANASHELRTPLAVVTGAIKTLKGPARDDAEGRQKFIEMMDQHASRMTRLIEDLLSLSRLELNANTAPEEKVDLAAVLSSVIATAETSAAERSIRVALEPGLTEQVVAGDELELTQLFQNLVDNAVKYSSENTLVRIITRECVRPEALTGPDDEPFIEISINDQGEGIPAEHLPRLTERFYRVDTARSREMGGTGLGLAIVKHIVNRHRGTMKISSIENVGSKFSIFLPRA